MEGDLGLHTETLSGLMLGVLYLVLLSLFLSLPPPHSHTVYACVCVVLRARTCMHACADVCMWRQRSTVDVILSPSSLFF